MSGPGLVEELAARCQFPDPEHVSCAVSGGADSLALLVLARHRGHEVTAIHVDHGLRDGSETEAALVADAAAQFGADFEARHVTVEDGPNLEARARAARYGVLPNDVLVGHTADDQAETMLLNLIRGAGVDGMAAMSSAQRPLLSLRRAETQALCTEVGLVPFVDPMNSDPRFGRVRVRTEVIPLLNEIADRDVVDVLCRQADHFRDLASLLGEMANDLDPTDAKQVRSAAGPVAAAALRRWLQEQTGAEHPVDSASLARVLAVAAGTWEATEIPGGHRVARTDQCLRVERAEPDETQ